MDETFRKSMSWLHTWGSLWFGWVLYVVFVSGTLSVFAHGISHWMESATPPVPDAQPAACERCIDFAQNHLQRVSPRGVYWYITLPEHAGEGMHLWYQDAAGKDRDIVLDVNTGKPMGGAQRRATDGGHHFVALHYELRAGVIGVWVVGLTTMAMLVALVSGVVVHRRIFRDFFTFRPRAAAQRAWLDGHNLTGVLTLPFLLMIGYTGIAIFYAIYLPFAINARFGDEDKFYAVLYDNPANATSPDSPPATLQRLSPLVERASAMLPRGIAYVQVDRPNSAAAQVTVAGRGDESLRLTRLRPPANGAMSFSGATGEHLKTWSPGLVQGGVGRGSLDVINTLHMATFGGVLMKWVYFLLGVAGSVTIASGLLLFPLKRRKADGARIGAEFGTATARMDRMIDVLNVAVIAGVLVACASYFVVNRLLPAGLEHRRDWEFGLFFLVWAAMLLHAIVRPYAKAWREQFAFLAVLCFSIPVLNALSGSGHVFQALAVDAHAHAAVDLTALAFGLAATWLAVKLGPARTRRTS